MKKGFSLPRGTADLLPDDAAVWSRLEKVFRSILETYHYREIRTPCFEETELFARSMGQTTDVVMKQMLHLASQKASEPDEGPEFSGLSLRPEGTAAVARSYIQNRIDRQESLSKLFYFGPMFRGERPQKGRMRQFHQIGVEAIGPDSTSARLDAEILALAMHLLEAMGLKEHTLEINSLGSPEDKERFATSLRDQMSPYLNLLGEEDQTRFERNVFRILDSKDPRAREVVKQINLNYDYLSQDSRAYYEELQNILGELRIPFKVNPRLVRGLDYYTHLVFEIKDSRLGSQDALGAGGRYNRLIPELGGPDHVHAVGFALGIERLLLAAGKDFCPVQPQLDCFLVWTEEVSGTFIQFVLDALRRNGFRADTSFKCGSFKSQLRQANKNNARLALIFGREEMEKGIVTVKDMSTGEQKSCPCAADQLEFLIEFVTRKG